MKTFYKELALTSLALAIAACSASGPAPRSGSMTDMKLNSIDNADAEIADQIDFTLEILHVNDVHSYIDANKVSLKTPAGLVRVKVGGPEAIKSVIEERRKANPDVLVISAGDQITGNASN